MHLTHSSRLAAFAGALVVGLVGAGLARGQGAVMPVAGPVNRSMGGAAVGAPLDPAGAIYWNPATMGDLQNEVLFAAGIIYGDSRLTSTIPAGALGAGVPAAPQTGTDRSDSGVAVLPTFALLFRPEDSPLTLGFGVFSAGGFYANYPANPQNPLVAPPPPNGFGVGPIFSSVSFLQIYSTAAYALTDQLSIGVGPIVNAVALQVTPGLFAAPDDANGDGVFTAPPAINTRLHWGLGFLAGVYWKNDRGWQLGASYKSPQWFERFSFNSTDELGFPRQLHMQPELPMIFSVGGAYTGLECWTFALDYRLLNYRDAALFGDPAAFDATGRLTGLGWRNVHEVATGVQYRLSATTSLRMGYLYNGNPIPDEATLFNVATANLYQHSITVGMTTQVLGKLKVSVALVHSFENAIEGPFHTPSGAIPGGSVRVEQRSDIFETAIGLNF
ncbi:MAG: outer membrane protein transport protein [Planctomycetia bacterium]|nr:outer membrane protein transport protein [Planctomycetia bacterium]